jgi:hypothetical protein
MHTPAAMASTDNTRPIFAKFICTNGNTPVAISHMPSKSMPKFFVPAHFIDRLLLTKNASFPQFWIASVALLSRAALVRRVFLKRLQILRQVVDQAAALISYPKALIFFSRQRQLMAVANRKSLPFFRR